MKLPASIKKGFVLIFSNRKQLFLLLAILLTCGCSESHERPTSPFGVLPKQGTFINGRFKIGDKLPAFTANDYQGNPCLVDQSKHADRYTMVIFWRSETGFFKRKISKFNRLFEKYNPKGLEIISVNANGTNDANEIPFESSKKSRAIEASPSVAWTRLYDNSDNQLQEDLGLRTWPSIFILNHEGTIISSHFDLNSIFLQTDPWSGDSQEIHSLDLTLHYLFNSDFHNY